MDEVIACRVTLEEKRLLQALAERRDQFVAGLLRELLTAELDRSFGPKETAPSNDGGE